MSERNKDLKEIIGQIQSWHSEAVNFRNDGWVQQEYKNRLETLYARVAAVMESIRPSEEKEEEKEED